MKKISENKGKSSPSASSHAKKKTRFSSVLRPELVVFGIIILLVAALSLISIPQSSNSVQSSLPNLGAAPELTGTQQWINTEPLTLEELKGKVVVVDFWTYSCINCIRTIPYLNAWHEKYADKGLVIIGVHSPEFEFEKDYNNVLNAVDQYSIKYPVVQDNNFATWRAYNNRYWPHKFIIDRDGNIRYDHIGEGAYEETEKVIQELLGTAGETSATKTPDFSQIGTPELYLGYNFARAPLGNAEGFRPDEIVDYKPVEVTQANIVYLSGKWENSGGYTKAIENSSFFLYYKAKDVNIVAGGAPITEIMLDNAPLAAENLGRDASIENGIAYSDALEEKLYNIVSANNYDPHLLEVRVEPGFRLYTFTFG